MTNRRNQWTAEYNPTSARSRQLRIVCTPRANSSTIPAILERQPCACSQPCNCLSSSPYRESADRRASQLPRGFPGREEMLLAWPLSPRPALFRCSGRPPGIQGARSWRSLPCSQNQIFFPANKHQTCRTRATFLFSPAETAGPAHPADPATAARKIPQASSCRYSRNSTTPGFVEILSIEATATHSTRKSQQGKELDSRGLRCGRHAASQYR